MALSIVCKDNNIRKGLLNIEPEKILDHAKTKVWEGVIAKKMDSRYISGKRSPF